MSIATLAELKTQIINTAHRDDLTGYVDNLILLGERYLFRKCRTPEMETTGYSDTMSSGTVSVPSGFLGWKWVQVSGTPTRYLKVRPANWIMEQYPLRSSTQKPFFIGRDGSSFIFGPYPDSDYTILGTYYARPTTVLASPNSFFLANPDAYLFAALGEVNAFVKNVEELPFWQAKRDQIVHDINTEHEDAQMDGSLRMTPDFQASYNA